LNTPKNYSAHSRALHGPVKPLALTRVLFLIAVMLSIGALMVQQSSEASAQRHRGAKARHATNRRPGKPNGKPSPKSVRAEARPENEPVAEEADNPEGRSEWFMFQRTYPFGAVPDGARRRAWDAALRGRNLSAPQASSGGWTPIGPGPTTSAFPANGGVTSGRINAIAVSPANSQIVLIGSATGGIWRSTDGGTTFSPVSDDQVDLAVGTISFAPSSPNIVYAGMGDLDNGYFGTGVLKSTDSGATWTKVSNATFPVKGNCTRIQVDPLNANKVIVSQYNFLNLVSGGNTVSGIYVSNDGGVNWTRTLTCLASDVVFHPTDAQIVYAGVRFSFTDSPGLFKSTDGGTTWNRVFTSPYTSTQSATREFRVAVTPANPNRVYVYFGTRTTTPFEVRLEMSDDAGATWTNRGVICGSCGANNTIIDPGQFGYNTYLVASPVDADTVYVGSRDIFRSTDKGVSFTDITNAFAPPWPDGNYTPNKQKFHSDQQSFAFAPGSGTTFYAGNDGGIWKTTDSGATFTSLNSTLSLTQFVGIGVHPTDATKSYGGAQDNGTQRRTTGTGWTEFDGGDGGKLVIDPVNPSRVYTSYVEGQLTRHLSNGTVYDGLISKSDSFGEPSTGARINFYPPIVGNGTDSKLYVGTWRLFICTDCDDTNKNYNAGVTWTAPGGTTDLTNGSGDVLSAIAVAKSNNNVIYTGSSGGRAMRSVNGGVDWTDITTGLPVRSITSFTVSPTDPTLVYLTVSGYSTGHIFRSTNSGTTWTDLSNNLPNIPTSAFLIDPLLPTTLYAGTDIGVFRSTDGGGSWTSFNNGLPPVPVMSFTAQPSGLIQIGTYGRGAYEIISAACSYQLSGTNQNFVVAGGAGTVNVTTTAGCAWTAVSNSAFITVVTGANGNGNGTVTFNVAANTGAARTGTLTIAGQTFTVTQDAAPPLPSTFQFSAAGFTGSETSGIATLTVTRTGSTTGAATVDYATSDGTALQKSDYSIAGGTLNFAAGDTQKTITLLINDDAYVEGDETFTVNLSNVTGAGATLGVQTSTTVTITDNDTASAQVPNTKVFVADLTPQQETPATTSTARGAAILQLSADEATAKVSMTITRPLPSAETGAHIHGPGGVGVAAPILFPLPGTGNFLDFAITLTPAQVAQLKAGQWYINVHTANNPGGDIRGQWLANPMDDPQTFVQQHYYDFLARVPDAGGLGFWTNEITKQGTDPIKVRTQRVGNSNAFFYEAEYQQTGAYTYRLYRAAYGNNQPFPNTDNSNQAEAKKLPSYSVFANDRARVVGGANVVQGQQDLAAAFVARTEFTNKYPLTLDGPGFIAAVLNTIKTDIGVDLTGQQAALLTQFNSGGRAAVMYRLADDNATNPIANKPFIDAEYNRSFVATQYFGYLRRDPEIGGFLFWLGQVNGAPLRDVPRQNALVCSFITSAEYQVRFGSVVSRNNGECPQ
jgi:hypothetical protein